MEKSKLNTPAPFTAPGRPAVEEWARRDLVLLHKIAVKTSRAEQVQESLAYVLEQVCRHQSWTVGHVFLLRHHPIQEYYPVDSLWICARPSRFREFRDVTRASSFKPGEGLIGSVARDGRPTWVANVKKAAPPIRPGGRAHGEVRSGLLIPVTVQDEPIAVAVLEFFSGEHRRMSPARLRLAAGVGSLLGRVFERERAERRLAESREAEQQRLGRELHDTISQDLTGITLMAERLQEALESERSPHLDRMNKLVDHLSQARSRVHALSRGLLPADIEASGLGNALQNLAAKTQELYGLACVVNCPEAIDLGDPVVANHLARIAQEALQNAAKHAGAERIEISLLRRGDRITMTVTDDGTGFSARNGRGVGLLLMGHRAASIGAELKIISRPGKGTRVGCDLRR